VSREALSRTKTLELPQKTAGTPLASSIGIVADLITAGRRECWGSQIGEAKGHRNHAMPFCFCTAIESFGSSPGFTTKDTMDTKVRTGGFFLRVLRVLCGDPAGLPETAQT